jgi:hypothetical protein
MHSFACLLRVSHGPKAKDYRNLIIFLSDVLLKCKWICEVMHSSKVYHTTIFPNLLLKDNA